MLTPAIFPRYIDGKLKARHIPGTAGTHRRLNPGTLAPLYPPIFPVPVGRGGDTNDWCIMCDCTFQNVCALSDAFAYTSVIFYVFDFVSLDAIWLVQEYTEFTVFINTFTHPGTLHILRISNA